MSSEYKDRYDADSRIEDLWEIKNYIDSKFAELESRLVVNVADKATAEIEKIINGINNLGKK